MKRSGILSSLLGAWAVAGVLVAPGISHASPVEQRPAVTVRFDDLDLHTRTGVESLLHRITIAGNEVCAPYALHGSILSGSAHQYCVRTVVDAAVSRVHSPLVTALHNERHDQHFMAAAGR